MSEADNKAGHPAAGAGVPAARAGVPAEIDADTTMGEALRRDPNLPMVLMRFHIGGCSMCGFEASDTVRKVAEDNGVPLPTLLDALNGR